MKRAQAAMEFLMTYGWAILVVLIAIGALAYFGVLNPSRFLPASCTLIPGLSCDEFVIAPDAGAGADVTIVARNGMGDDLTAVTLTLVGEGTTCQAAGHTGAPLATWSDGAQQTFAFVCGTEPSGTRFKSDITVAYTKGTLAHSATGSITGQVE